MAGPLLLGYVRALVCGPDIDWQYAQIKAAGVTDRLTYADALPGKNGDPRRMFGEVCRAIRSGDCLVVPNLAIFARTRPELLSGLQALETKRIALYSVEDKIDTRLADPDFFFKLAAAERRAVYIWRREQTAAASKAPRRRKSTGRRPKLSQKQREAARLLWLDPEDRRGNVDVAKAIGLSPTRCWTLFGARGR